MHNRAASWLLHVKLQLKPKEPQKGGGSLPRVVRTAVAVPRGAVLGAGACSGGTGSGRVMAAHQQSRRSACGSTRRSRRMRSCAPRHRRACCSCMQLATPPRRLHVKFCVRGHHTQDTPELRCYIGVSRANAIKYVHGIGLTRMTPQRIKVHAIDVHGDERLIC